MQRTPVIRFNCPHCDIRQAAFTVKGQYDYSEEGDRVAYNGTTALYICPNCNEGIVVTARNGQMHKIYPQPKTHALDGLPPEVERYFKQGVDCLSGNYDAAGMMFRKSLEVGLGNKFPDTKGLLVHRIRELSASGALTQDLAAWADHIRLEGNDAAHDQFTKGQAEELLEFTRLVLNYLFVLPKIAQKADAARQEKKAAAKAETKK